MIMKNSSLYFFSLILLPISLVSICKQPIAPEPVIKLELSNGYFQLVETTPTHQFYEISFDYRVTGTECNIYGYGIMWNMDSGTSIN